MDAKDLTPAAQACTQEYAALTDVATARDFARLQSNKIIAAYFGDTSGQLFRYSPGGGLAVDQSFGCLDPVHFSPTVVQLDRDSLATTHGHEIYLVQVTNSTLDIETDTSEPSKIVLWKELAQADPATGAIGTITKDELWANKGNIVLTAGNGAEICGVTEVNAQGKVTCKTPMPTNARPTSTPTGFLLKDASGFQFMTTWYVPSVDGCSKGQSYLTVHQVAALGTVEQRAGLDLASEPVTSPLVLGGRVYVFGANGAIEITKRLPDVITPGVAIPPSAQAAPFTRFDWREVN
jgi:hypothetical protein